MATSPTAYAQNLSHSQLFHGIPLPMLEALISTGKILKSKAGDSLVFEGERVPGLFVILEGSVKVVKHGKESVTQFGRGGFFGEISIFGLSLGATASIMTASGCTSLLITRDQLVSWFKVHPDCELVFLRHLARELCQRLYSTTEKLAGS